MNREERWENNLPLVTDEENAVIIQWMKMKSREQLEGIILELIKLKDTEDISFVFPETNDGKAVVYWSSQGREIGVNDGSV